ncbi:hypothetical protein [Salinisphaera sp. T31B1]|uniref:hypothetical protein n=1 Tax=Salinisphaera sp. T31B1 TaxID=727963 RepID=UPI003341B73A
MTGTFRHPNDKLGRYLEHAADALPQSGKSLGQDTEGLLFLGAWHQSYPAILVRDPFLSDSAKVHLLYLTQESSRQPHRAIAMPSLDQTADVLGHAKKTINRDRTLLRVCRWISQYTRLRDDKGRYRGTVNAVHGEPCSLSEANRLDASYLSLLDSAKEHTDRYLRQAAQAALASVDQALQEGRDPLEPADPMIRRLDAANAVHNGGGSFFDLLMTGSRHDAPQDKSSAAGHSVATALVEEKVTIREPGVKTTPGETDPMANFTIFLQATDKKEFSQNRPRVEKSTIGPTCSSSNKTTTTTTHSETDSARAEKTTTGPAGHTVANADMALPLRWPDALPANERTLIERAFVSRNLRPEQRQDVLDALARKLQDPDNPLRSPVGYAVSLCKHIQSGTFQPVGAPTQPEKTDQSNSPANAKASDLRQQMRNLRSEIQAMESTLIPGAPPGSRAALESQRDRLRQQLEQLRRRLRNPGGAPASADPSPM